LSHTPLRFMGINRNFHYNLDTENDWHALGHRLVPKQDWDHLLEKPGMQNVSVMGQRPDEFKGHVQVMVQPSTRIKYGIFIEVNDHYMLKDEKEIGGAETARIILSEKWNDSMTRSLKIAQTIATVGENK
jgi:hypothetical protein